MRFGFVIFFLNYPPCDQWKTLVHPAVNGDYNYHPAVNGGTLN